MQIKINADKGSSLFMRNWHTVWNADQSFSPWTKPVGVYLMNSITLCMMKTNMISMSAVSKTDAKYRKILIYVMKLRKVLHNENKCFGKIMSLSSTIWTRHKQWWFQLLRVNWIYYLRQKHVFKKTNDHNLPILVKVWNPVSSVNKPFALCSKTSIALCSKT